MALPSAVSGARSVRARCGVRERRRRVRRRRRGGMVCWVVVVCYDGELGGGGGRRRCVRDVREDSMGWRERMSLIGRK